MVDSNTTNVCSEGQTAEAELNAAMLFGSHHVVSRHVARAAEECSQSVKLLQQCRSQIEACANQARRFEVRLKDGRHATAQLVETLDRIKLVALNTGLEGARMGEPAGKALVSVADEVRTLATRGLEIVVEQVQLLENAEAEQQILVQDAEQAQAQAKAISNLMSQACESQRDTLVGLAELERNIERASGIDPRTARELEQIAEHTQALLTALEQLTTDRRQRAVHGLVRPALLPLLAALTRDSTRGEPQP